jgi:hypothetical protein
MTYHLLYTLEDSTFISEERAFASFAEVEGWLESIGAVYWEIGA